MPLKKYFKAFPSFCNAWLSQLFSQILFQGKFHLECKGNQINWARPFLFCSFVTFFSLVFYVSTFCCFFFLFVFAWDLLFKVCILFHCSHRKIKSFSRTLIQSQIMSCLPIFVMVHCLCQGLLIPCVPELGTWEMGGPKFSFGFHFPVLMVLVFGPFPRKFPSHVLPGANISLCSVSGREIRK